MKRWAIWVGFIFLGALGLGALGAGAVFAQTESHQTAQPHGAGYSVRILPLPDNNMGDVTMDYLGYDPSTNTVWVPGGNTGAVDVIDAATDNVRQITGFPTRTAQIRGATRVQGPSSVSVGEGGVIYIGSRGDASVCAFDSRTFAKGACGHFDVNPDGVAYVAPTGEVWVTTPNDKSIRILDAKSMTEKAKLTFDGNPEGYAVDGRRGRFYTNMEDKDLTLAIDLKTHKTVATWHPSCGSDGPHGISLDERTGHLYIACSTLAEVMDVGHDGAILSKIDTGDGDDDLKYVPATHLLYVGAARAAKLTIARADNKGQLTVVAQVPTQEGARNGVVDKNGNVYLGHAAVKMAGVVVVTPARK